jgi:phosphoribosylglycinamide formyltransferase-1
VDHGPIIVQVAVPVSPEEDTETVRRRILAQEHRIYVHAIQWFAEERVRVVGRKAIIEGRAPIGTEALVSPPLRT